MERLNCTDADAAPRLAAPATICTVTCTMGMAVPSDSDISRNTAGSHAIGTDPAPSASSSQHPVATANPQDGYTAVRPVRATARPVSNAPTAIPAVSGSSSSPTCPGPAPRTTCR